MNIFEFKEYIVNEVKEGQKLIDNMNNMNKKDKEIAVQAFISKNAEHFDKKGWYEGIALKDVNFNADYKSRYDSICSNIEQIAVEHPEDTENLNKYEKELEKFLTDANINEERGCEYLKKEDSIVFGFFLCEESKDKGKDYKELYYLNNGTFIESNTTCIEKKFYYSLTRDISYTDSIDSNKWNMESILINSMLAITEHCRKCILNMISKIDVYNYFNKENKNKEDLLKLKKSKIEITQLLNNIDKKSA